MPARSRGELRGIAVAVAIVVAVLAGLQLARVWDALDDLLFDAFTVVAPTRPAQPSPVVVVGIDEPSFAELRQRWPWPRALHARLTESLTHAGAATVVFDVLFSEPSDPADDAALARAIAAAKGVVLAGEVSLQETAHFSGLQRVEALPELREAGAATGIATIEVGADQVVRRFPADAEAMWRVALQKYRRVVRSDTGSAEVRAGDLVRYSDGSDVGYVSYYQALEAARLLPPGSLAGKIALVGLVLKTSPDAKRAADTYATPFLRFSRQFAPGVEIQAQFIAAALAGRIIVPFHAAWTWILAALVVAAGALALRRWTAARAAGYAGFVALAVMGAAYGAFASGHYLAVSPVLGGAFLLLATRGATAYVDERRRRDEIRRAFEYYVSPDVVEQMTSHPELLRLGGDRRDVTIMFTDLAGFTTMAEGSPPEDVARVLNEHLTRMTSIVLAHGGTIDKFIGDAVMAFWGAPLPHPDHALHAVEAALEMQADMKRWRREPGRPPLRMRIGINTGPVVVGNLGSKDRFAYTVIGDAVNLAARLEPVNRLYGTGIMLSGATAALVAGRIPLREVDRVRVKGKTEPTGLFSPSEDAALVAATDAAIAAYRSRDWDAAEAAWRRVDAIKPGDGIAIEYLGRIEVNRRYGVPAEWDGTFDLESK